jgi:glucose/arabinose dehydrogenase
MKAAKFIVCAQFCLVATIPICGADGPAAGKTSSPGATMDYGPYLASSLISPAQSKSAAVAAMGPALAYKGLTIKVGNGACVCFDTDTLRYAAGWTGGFLNLAKTHMTTPKGDGPPCPGWPLSFTTADGPGWADVKGSLADPRADPLAPRLGPLPKDQAHYRGLYLYDGRVVLAYTVGTTNVLETPRAVMVGDELVFARTIRIDRPDRPLTMVLGNATGHFGAVLAGAPEGVKVETREGRLIAAIPAFDRAISFTILFGNVDRARLDEAAKSLPATEDLAGLMHGGPPRWMQPVVVSGTLGRPSPGFPYVVDTLTLPFDNPYGAWMRVTAFDFFPDGKSAALCTWNGDVWVVSGIDDSLKKLVWKRFATGLYEPLGLKIINGVVHVTCRDQITRLHDLNGDGEADFYENFNNDLLTSHQYHEFKFDLDTDPDGNLCWISCGAWNTTAFARDYGQLIRMSPDGQKIDRIARGFRAPNGMAVGPSGEIVTGDNQGHWMPASKINYIPPGKVGGFYGFVSDPRMAKGEFDETRIYGPGGVPRSFEPPLCWVPYSLDTSSGGQAFVTGDKWGPFKGSIVHTSYGKSALFVVLYEIVDGVAQGGVWQMPLRFESGIQRARFNLADGQLYVCGLRGWQSGGSKDGCFQRVRYTGGPVHAPTGLRATDKGIYLTFASKLDPASAGDSGNFDVEQWNYRWTADYGSADYSVESPAKKGRDPVSVESVKLLGDGRTVFLSIPSIRPVMQMGISYHLKSADGKTVEGAVYNTINRLGRQ